MDFKSMAMNEILFDMDDKFYSMEKYINLLEEQNDKLRKDLMKSYDDSINNSNNIIGTVFSALLDKDSVISKGIKADMKDKIGENIDIKI